MELSRRGFLKLTGASFVVTALVDFGFKAPALAAPVEELRIKRGKESSTICCYCAVGCGGICTAEGEELINLEGDPDHPINEGTLCSKGMAQFNIRNIYTKKGELKPNPFRLTKVMYRAPGGKDWEEKSWDWAMTEIAKRVKGTRDAHLLEKEGGVTVNRNEAIANLGGAAIDDEECYLIQKLARALGMVYIEHQARI